LPRNPKLASKQTCRLAGRSATRSTASRSRRFDACRPRRQAACFDASFGLRGKLTLTVCAVIEFGLRSNW